VSVDIFLTTTVSSVVHVQHNQFKRPADAAECERYVVANS